MFWAKTDRAATKYFSMRIPIMESDKASRHCSLALVRQIPAKRMLLQILYPPGFWRDWDRNGCVIQVGLGPSHFLLMGKP
jgi:hypothetical protein